MNIKEEINLKGIFHLDVIKNGKIIDSFTEHNLIVNLCRSNLARLMAGDENGSPIGKISFGTSNRSPEVTDTTITNPYTKNIDSYNFPEAGRVTFNWSLATTEANGKSILEFGLLSANGTLNARKVRVNPINKESDISLLGTWTIIF